MRPALAPFTRPLAITVSLFSLLTALPIAAQRPTMDDPAFSQAASAILTYDHFATKCAAGKGMSPGDAAQVEQWTRTHRVDVVRARMRELATDQRQKAQLDAAVSAIVKKYGQLSLWACRAALQSTKRPESQFASRSPAMLLALESTDAAVAEPRGAAVPARTSNDSAQVGRPRDGATTADTSRRDVGGAEPQSPPRGPLMEELDGFVFDTRAKMGIGGFMALDVYPIVVFRNGDALTDVTGLAFEVGLEQHRANNPDDWTRWRRAGGELQLLKNGAWAAPSFQVLYQALPAGFRLDGLFRSLSGTGNVAVGGSQQVAAWREYRFSRDGTVVRTGGAGSQASAGNTSVATRSAALTRRGQYAVDGLTLRIAYDDGTSESRILIADPQDPKTAIWLDGVSYVQRRP